MHIWLKSPKLKRPNEPSSRTPLDWHVHSANRSLDIETSGWKKNIWDIFLTHWTIANRSQKLWRLELQAGRFQHIVRWHFHFNIRSPTSSAMWFAPSYAVLMPFPWEIAALVVYVYDSPTFEPTWRDQKPGKNKTNQLVHENSLYSVYYDPRTAFWLRGRQPPIIYLLLPILTRRTVSL